MIFIAATDGKRETVASDGRRMGRSRCASSDAYNFGTGVGVAIMNAYLSIPASDRFPLQGYRQYYILEVETALMIEMAVSAMYNSVFMRKQELAEEWGKMIKFAVVSFAPSLEIIQRDHKQIKIVGSYL